MRQTGNGQDSGRGGIRGHGHAAIRSQHSHSSVESQERQVKANVTPVFLGTFVSLETRVIDLLLMGYLSLFL